MVSEYINGECGERQWGEWKVLFAQDGYVVKQLRIKSNSRISLQSHRHRHEYWVIVSGEAMVTMGGYRQRRVIGEGVFLPSGVRHRVENTGNSELVIIEVQLGDLLSEADIIRYRS